MPRLRTLTLTLALAVVLIPACDDEPTTPQERSESMVLSDNKALVRRVVDDVFNRGDLAAADALVSADWVDHNPGAPGLPKGPAGLKALVGTLRTAFPDLTLTIEDMVAEGDRVADRFTIRGTHRGSLNGIPATGRTVAFTGTAIHKIAGGRIVESWANLDDLGLLRRLGVVP